ncbi:LolA family protein [Jeotgalibacillus salarius]|uniref:Outer membrane lipoprotein carrier protein LolA n=1 Tax=Jeotgalibacillus salarius TaxID=546023 RepID=A0A4Y8LHM1_9BACL|nr:outer membrane lipoprotein carrier protein LolA [Jeotgalibacillus salarius]TFE01978.1 outer membrane lipoprotein carrier protein LolA [Jeotgalibacillus salarius]
MKKIALCLITVFLVMLLAACGEKTREEAAKDLMDKVEQTDSYKAKAKMVFKTGETPQEYDVEVWHMKPHFYRVHLKHAEDKQSQMIIRNDEGVFVLTPALNKSFRFQSDWPSNGSQAYLAESLVKDIQEDKEAVFTEKEGQYVFDTKTRYKHQHMFPLQQVIFDKKTLAPTDVKVKDEEGNVKIELSFSEVDYEASFDKSDFNLEKNMMGAQLEMPVSGDGEETEDWAVLYPTAEIEGAALTEEKEVKTDNGSRMILTYEGAKSYTIIQEKLDAAPVMLTTSEASGEMADLGFAVGAMTEHSLEWTYNGVSYLLASHDLTQEEMLEVARSVQGSMIK